MFDSDVLGTIIEAIANDLKATAEYIQRDTKDGIQDKRCKLVLHVTAARDMLNDALGDIEER